MGRTRRRGRRRAATSLTRDERAADVFDRLGADVRWVAT